MRLRKSEVNALVPLLRQEWDSEQDLAEALIRKLDETRVNRTSYVGVLQVSDKRPVYVGMGPYPGAASARAAVASHPVAGMACLGVIVPVMTPEALAQMTRDLDNPPAPRGNFEDVAADAVVFRQRKRR